MFNKNLLHIIFKSDKSHINKVEVEWTQLTTTKKLIDAIFILKLLVLYVIFTFFHRLNKIDVHA